MNLIDCLMLKEVIIYEQDPKLYGYRYQIIVKKRFYWESPSEFFKTLEPAAEYLRHFPSNKLKFEPREGELEKYMKRWYV